MVGAVDNYKETLSLYQGSCTYEFTAVYTVCTKTQAQARPPPSMEIGVAHTTTLSCIAVAISNCLLLQN